MLTSFTLENFKSFREPATLPLAPLTMLVGANASGKSNLVEALCLSSWIAKGLRVTENPHPSMGGGNPVRGRLKDLGFEQNGSFSFSFQTDHPEWDGYSITLEYEDNQLYISDENITSTKYDDPLYEFKVIERLKGVPKYSDRILKTFLLSETSGILVDAEISVLQSMQGVDRVHHCSKGKETIGNISSRYRYWLSHIAFMDPKPSEMRGYCLEYDKPLRENGENISSVLYDLCCNDVHKSWVLNFIKSLPEQNIRDIDFFKTPRNEVMVKLMETFGGREKIYDATLLSDGTLRVLAIAAAVLSAKEDSLVIIEEIDNGLHPSRAEALLQQLDNVARERNLRLLLTTHNPALLDALPQEAVPDVVFCFRHPETGASQLTRLSDLHDYPGLAAQGGIGKSMTRGLVDRFVKDLRTPEQRKQDMLAWLEELEARAG